MEPPSLDPQDQPTLPPSLDDATPPEECPEESPEVSDGSDPDPVDPPDELAPPSELPGVDPIDPETGARMKPIPNGEGGFMYLSGAIEDE